jgi:hypothetical protein
MPKQAWPGCSPNAAFERLAQRIESASDFSICTSVAGNGAHSSSTIWISEPRRRWISIARSGDRNSSVPSICERKRTPSSLILRSPDSDITWKPPESVRIGRSQPMNRCKAAEPRNAFRTRPQHQVIGVAEQDIGAGFAHRLRQHGLHCRRRPHRHEGRRADFAARGMDCARPRVAVGRVQFEAECGHAALNKRQASP